MPLLTTKGTSSVRVWGRSSKPPIPQLYPFTSHTFHPSVAVGRYGPTLAQCKTSYGVGWTDTLAYFDVVAGIQYWTVPVSGSYTIEAHGAGAEVRNGGKGAVIKGTFNLIKNEIVRILVGQRPNEATVNHGGGAGGTFVVRTPFNTNASILVVAGGGGGGHQGVTVASNHGGITTSGEVASNPGGAPGINGNGATGGDGSGGCGFLTATGAGAAASTLGTAFINGGVGSWKSDILTGGFGGGGNEGTSHGGGGGGYSGGASSGPGIHHGGGGGSYNSGTSQVNTAGLRSGNGQVIVTLIESTE